MWKFLVALVIVGSVVLVLPRLRSTATGRGSFGGPGSF